MDIISINQSIYLSIYLSFFLSIYLSIHLSIIYLYMCIERINQLGPLVKKHASTRHCPGGFSHHGCGGRSLSQFKPIWEFPRMGIPQKMMVYNGQVHLKLMITRGYPHFRKPPDAPWNMSKTRSQCWWIFDTWSMWGNWMIIDYHNMNRKT